MPFEARDRATPATQLRRAPRSDAEGSRGTGLPEHRGAGGAPGPLCSNGRLRRARGRRQVRREAVLKGGPPRGDARHRRRSAGRQCIASPPLTAMAPSAPSDGSVDHAPFARSVATPRERLAAVALHELPDESDEAAVRAWVPSAAFRAAVRTRGHRRVAARHGGLGQPHLSFRQRELAAVLAPTCPRGLEPGHGYSAPAAPALERRPWPGPDPPRGRFRASQLPAQLGARSRSPVVELPRGDSSKI